MRGLGTIYLFKNRELAFEFNEDNMVGFMQKSGLNGTAAHNDIFLARQKQREDLSFIDSASAVLSVGGGRAYSIRSSTLKSLASVLTPPTNPSVASSAFRSVTSS